MSKSRMTPKSIRTRQKILDAALLPMVEKGYEKATEFKADVLQEFKDEGISGRSDNRPGFESAIEY